ncbi:MAG: hypothetical protein KGY56_04545 [Desulfobacterales bacterium]|nr:hypothetical protein [Desulfobacterales bacterium]
MALFVSGLKMVFTVPSLIFRAAVFRNRPGLSSLFFNIDGFVKSCLFRCGGIFAERKSVSTLADRRREKGVSSLQEPLRVSISARKPAFPHRRQVNEVQFRKSEK